MKTELKKVGGWTPIIDTLAMDAKYGLKGAAVFGVVWRHCQMRDGVCNASQDHMRELIGVGSRVTMEKYLKRLVKDGYLIDMTPGVKHKPHIYKDAGKLNMAISMEVEPTEIGVHPLYTSNDDKLGEQSGVQRGVQVGVQPLYINTLNTLNKTEKKEKDTTTTDFVASQNSSTNFATQQNNVPTVSIPSVFSSHSGLVDKVHNLLLKSEKNPNGYEHPDDDLIRAAIKLWCADCEKIKADHKEWSLTNYDAILERYDVLYLVTGHN
jgi:hypothetical protein